MTQHLESCRPANHRHHRDRLAQPRREPGRAAWPATVPEGKTPALPALGAATPLSSELWTQLCAIESEAEALDRALRRAWYVVGGLLLPCAGLLLYSLALPH
ncbi:hypothetical protein VX159_02975 [Dechloromonas sp. ZY10]|uniref:hypothetical protein n=1 Tax=Dechloromonas aquae TaxID=2664436 RepID=UPI003526CA20